MADVNYNKLIAQILGAVLVLVGLLGFVMDPVLGIFEVSPLHNVVHLLTGGILLAGAFMNAGANARTVNIVLGVVYLLVAALGFVAEGFVETLLGGEGSINMADHVLHVALGVVLLGAAFMMRDTTTGAMRV